MTETLSSAPHVLRDAPATVAAGGSTTAYGNPFIRGDTTPVTFPNGAVGNYSTVTIGTGHGVLIVPTADGVAGIPGTSYGLLAVHRFPVSATLLEFPRGGADAGEGYLTAAIREAVEELGPYWARADYRRLGLLHPDSGLLTTQVAVYAAHLEHAPAAGHIEDITGATQVWIPAGQLTELITGGRISDAMTLAALALASCGR
ncbi:NUDIX hydrolase [Kocuria aegyptia]|uniref:Nudix hydrolase domain-containing protein n=1 Tax=Kocuria aegyptia TaxID=330943 RepID=A0ABN2K2X3_9MICC